ncbi:unnamed protein product [Rhodiola kirilowii]
MCNWALSMWLECMPAGHVRWCLDVQSQPTIKAYQALYKLTQLYELCAANGWRAPLFERCKEEGPSHLKLYTFKAVLEIVEARNMVIECIGSPCLKKKVDVDSAAEGTLWYLKQDKYLPVGSLVLAICQTEVTECVSV